MISVNIALTFPFRSKTNIAEADIVVFLTAAQRATSQSTRPVCKLRLTKFPVVSQNKDTDQREVRTHSSVSFS